MRKVISLLSVVAIVATAAYAAGPRRAEARAPAPTPRSPDSARPCS